MGNLLETPTAVLLEMIMENSQDIKKVEPSPYDGISLAPDVDPSLPAHEYLIKLSECLINQPILNDPPKKKHWWQK